ncbi:MAG: ATP-binding protein [Candidatus Melainabacteria bacterium]|nr:ATP-binding protein [Candidatus Melainabacteria bacterium]
MTEERTEQPQTYAEISKCLLETRAELDLFKKNHASLSVRIQKIITSFPLGLIIVNRDHQIEALNKRAVSSFNYLQEDLARKPVQVIFPELETLAVSAEPVRVTGRRKNGETFPCEICVNILEIKGQERYFVNVQDITERQRLEQLRKDLLAMVSHDIRQPLTAVRLVLDMVLKGFYGVMNPRGEKNVKTALSSIDYLIGLVKNLLDAEKIDSGIIEVIPAETTVGAIINKAIATADGAKQKASVTIETDFTNDVLVADEDRIVQVLINLISNAVKYSPDNGMVRVVAGLDGLNVKFRVIDQGPGIAQESHETIFDRYQQLEQHKSIKVEGFGLGLAICKAFVEKHGGRIWVESEVNRGATFCFTIPLSSD